MYFQCTSLSIHLYNEWCITHCSEVIMSAMASQITGVWIVCSTVCPGAYQGKYQRSASLASVRGIQRWPADSPHKGSVTRKFIHLMTSSWFCKLLKSLNEYQKKKCVFQILDAPISETIIISDVDNYGLQGDCYMKFGVSIQWLG